MPHPTDGAGNPPAAEESSTTTDNNAPAVEESANVHDADLSSVTSRASSGLDFVEPPSIPPPLPNENNIAPADENNILATEDEHLNSSSL